MDPRGPVAGKESAKACHSQGAAPGLILLVAPFYLNDFSSIFIQNWGLWLAIDYLLVKALPLTGVFWLVRTGRITALNLGFKSRKPGEFFFWAIGLTLICTLMDQNLYTLLTGLPGYPPLGGMPAITSSFWDWMDLTLGLALVALCEEMVFRGFFYVMLRRAGLGTAAIILCSSLAFGLAHWCLGLHAVVITGLIGAVLMAAYVRTRSIYSLVLAHFMVNFIDFAGVIPKSIFRFFT